jgi:hypothetical protein
MVEAANAEGEVAGVMAHEISHVVLRHGTAQASKAGKYALGQIAGQVLGAIIGGNVGSIVAQGTQFGLGTAFLRFSREYEKQADILGSQIMARAGYDPRDMANMFATIEKQGGSGGPQWLSDHPNPGNRARLHQAGSVDAARREPGARHTRVRSGEGASAIASTRANDRGGDEKPGRTTGGGARPGGVLTGSVEAPSGRYITYEEGGIFRVTVPSNWRELPSENSVTFAPEGGYGTYDGNNVFSHGVEMGLARNESHDLQTATDELLDSLRQGNPRMRQPNGYRRVSIGGRSGLTTMVTNVSDATGKEETIQISTTQLRDGNVLYVIAVAPSAEFGSYRSVFQRVVGSVEFASGL